MYKTDTDSVTLEITDILCLIKKHTYLALHLKNVSFVVGTASNNVLYLILSRNNGNGSSVGHGWID